MTMADPNADVWSGWLIRTGLFILMETAWIAALVLFLHAIFGDDGTGTAVSLLPAMITVLYPLAMAADGVISRINPRRWIGWGLHALAFGIMAILLVILIVPQSVGALAGAGGLRSTLDFMTGDADGQWLLILSGIGLFCWVRGVMLSGHDVTAFATAFGFQIGLVVMISLLVVSAAFEIDWPGAAALSFGFVIAGLLALWHIRARAGGRQSGSGRRNPGAALLGLGLVVGLGVTVAGLADGSIVEGLLALWQAVVAALGAIFAYLFSLLPDPGSSSAPMPEPSPGIEGERPSEPGFQPPASLRSIFTTILFGFVVLLVAVVLLANLRDLLKWLRQRRSFTPGLDYDWSRHGLRDSLRTLWRTLAEAIRAIGDRLVEAIRSRRGRTGARAPIRRAYARVASDLDVRGWPRDDGETPHEYARRIKVEWPGTGGDLTLLTRLYVQARYGRPRDIPPRRLRALKRKLRRSMKQVRHRPDEPQPSTSR